MRISAAGLEGEIDIRHKIFDWGGSVKKKR